MFRSAFIPCTVALAFAFTGVACDPPASTRPGGGDDGELSIVVLQTPSDPDYPGVDSRVLVRNVVVTAVDNYDEDGEGRIGNVWVAEPAGGAWSGIQLFNPVVIPSRARLVPGDIVEATGTLDEFVLLNADGTPMDRDGTLTELGSASVQKTGETFAPEPTIVPESDLANLASAEQWEDCLVRIEYVRLTGGYDSYGEAATEGGNSIANDLYEIPGAAPGMTIRSLTGIVTYFFGFKIMPRGPEDVVL
jgi:hypothetical protein